jgi:hypothetical protein
MKTQASEAEARLQKLKQARDESWSALSAALAVVWLMRWAIRQRARRDLLLFFR